PDSVYWLGSAKFSNEGSYLYRKFAAFWGTNNVDHQARICHSTTVAGVANTWGYGAMTNSYNDIRNAKTIMVMGGNPAEAHPVSLQHLLEGKELNRANWISVDPRMTRTAAHATEYVRVRASCILLLATGNVGNFGNGANIFRGHCNVQGATDLGLDIVTLPLYYGLVEGAWKHWCRVWEVDYDWMQSRFDSKQIMETAGIPSTRWFDATMLPKDQVAQ